jgi:hypothetical protein
VLRAKLGMAPESAAGPSSTNAPPAVTTTNAPSANR